MGRTFDSIIIGSGQAGPFLAARLAKAGQTVALVERKVLGGTCVNTGCTPTKAMVASAKVAHMAREAARFGIHLEGHVQVSLGEVKSRAAKIVQKSRQSLAKKLANAGCTVVYGQARFVSAHEIQVGEEILRGERIFINVGARAAIPKLPGLEDISYLTNSSLLELEELPKHLVIVGGGAVGVEFAQMFRRFGSEVTLVEMKPSLMHHEDVAASALVAELLQQEGVRLRLNAECISFSKDPDGVSVQVGCKEGDTDIHGSHVLLAMGRTPNTDDLGLDAAGVKTDSSGYVPVDDQLRTNVAHIWALGDCNRRGGFTHTAYNDFEIVAANLLEGGNRKVTDRIPARATYTDPPLAQVGMTEEEARATGRDLLIATRPMAWVSRAIEKSETFGLMKAIVDAKTKRIMGAMIFGVGGDEAIHSILDIMYADKPYTTITNAVHIHPTVAELIPTLLGSLQPANPTASESAGTAISDMKLEVVIIPVSDVDRSKEFYARLGWRLDADFQFDNGFRVVQFTPPGSKCSIQFGAKLTAAAPGSVRDFYLVVSDILAARRELVSRGVTISDVFHPATPGAQFQPAGAEGRLDGTDPGHTSYRSFATFSDPDGNRWLLQEVTARLPGRVASDTTYSSAADLSKALQRAAAAHGWHESRTGKADPNWPDWYAEYMVREQSGQELPR